MNIQTAVTCFSNLGHRRRLEIIKLLIKAAPHGLTMGEIAAKAHIPGSTLTHHILLLERVGMVKRQQESQSIHCVINTDLIKELAAFLLDECCAGFTKTC